MAYNLSSQGTGIKIINNINNQEWFFNEGCSINPITDPTGTKFQIKGPDEYLVFYQTEIGTIGGNAPAGTVDAILNQIVALFPAVAGTTANASVVNISDPVTPTQKAAVSAANALKVDGSAVTQPVSIATMPSTPVTGTVGVSSLPALPTGVNAIGSVGVTSLPALPTGTNSIGTVGVTALPSLPAGANAIGSVSVSNFPATQPVSGNVGVTSLPALPAGANAIGSVSVSNFPATQAISAASLPLPTGAATAANQNINVDVTVATLSAVAVSGNSADQVNVNGKGVQLVVDVTAITGTTPSITVTIQGKDAASGKYYNILTSAAISTVSTNLFTIYPGGLNTANVASPTVLPRTWRVAYTIAGTTPAVTATIGASIIV